MITTDHADTIDESSLQEVTGGILGPLFCGTSEPVENGNQPAAGPAGIPGVFHPTYNIGSLPQLPPSPPLTYDQQLVIQQTYTF